MQITINTDHNIEGGEALATHVSGIVAHALNYLRDHVTSVEVHLSESNKHGAQSEKYCVIEARLEHHQPLAATHHATSLHQSVEGATRKLMRLLDSALGRVHDQKTRSESFLVPDSSGPEA